MLGNVTNNQSACPVREVTSRGVHILSVYHKRRYQRCMCPAIAGGRVPAVRWAFPSRHSRFQAPRRIIPCTCGPFSFRNFRLKGAASYGDPVETGRRHSTGQGKSLALTLYGVYKPRIALILCDPAAWHPGSMSWSRKSLRLVSRTYQPQCYPSLDK